MPRIGGALNVPQVSDPATPVAGRQWLYFKSDGLLYTKKSDGTVVAISGGGGGVSSVTAAGSNVTVSPTTGAVIVSFSDTPTFTGLTVNGVSQIGSTTATAEVARFGVEGSLLSITGGTYLSDTAYYDGTNWRNRNTLAGTVLGLSQGNVYIYASPVGIAGGITALTQTLGLTAAGVLTALGGLATSAGSVSVTKASKPLLTLNDSSGTRIGTIGLEDATDGIGSGTAVGDLVLKSATGRVHVASVFSVFGQIQNAGGISTYGDILLAGSSMVMQNDTTPPASVTGNVYQYAAGGRSKILDDVGNVFNGDSFMYSRLSAQVPNSTTTQSATGLSLALKPGTYEIEIDGFYSAAAATTGIMFAWTFSGTQTNFLAWYTFITSAANAVTASVTSTLAGTMGVANASAGSTVKPLRIVASITVTVAGTLALTFASGVAASQVIFREAATMRATRTG